MALGMFPLMLLLLSLAALCSVRGLGRIASPRAYVVDDYRLTLRPTETEMEGLEEGARAWGFVYILLALGTLAIVWWLVAWRPSASGKENAVGVP